TLSVEDGADGSALVAIGFVDNGGGQGADSITVAPGGSDRVSVETNPGPSGILRVVVDFNSNFDNGRLTVHVDGTERNDEPITGDTTWSYSLT
ncbi:MAG TPA: hypothetical protein VGD27_14555, partial [Longimicrobiales bacterium]